MAYRPKLNISLTFFDILIEVIGWGVLLFFWFFTAYHYQSLPEIIPVHFNAAGTPDGYGSKTEIIALPIVSTVLFSGLTILNKFPHIFNYMTEITAENAYRQYSLAMRMIRMIKTSIIIVFFGIGYQTLQIAAGNSEVMGNLFLPISLGLISAPVFYYLIQASRSN